MLKCARCRRKITGEYIQALDRTWHPTCFRCAGCGRLIKEGQFASRDGKPYHEDCFHQAFGITCANCGRPIIGPYFTTQNKTYHPDCFVCTACKQPFGDENYVRHRGRPYHQNCHLERFAPRCNVCGAAMSGSHIKAATGEVYCKHHQGQVPECSSCGRLASDYQTGGYLRYNDGRIVCQLCRATAVDRDKEANRLASEVLRVLRKEGLSFSRKKIPVRLVDQNELRKDLKRRDTKNPTGMAKTLLTTQGDKVVERQVVEILALRGLPREHLGAVIAHELGHAHLFLQAFPRLRPRVEEGICELFAYLWLSKGRGERTARQIKLMEKNPDRTYGTGFRKARHAHLKRPLKRLLSHIKRHHQFPD